jgi:hypothetical protein
MYYQKIINLSAVIENIDSVPWEYALYIPSTDVKWSVEMPVMIADPDDTDSDEGDPEVVTTNGFKYGLSISEIQDVVKNIRMQKPKAGLEEVVSAVKYYFENDSFIRLF